MVHDISNAIVCRYNLKIYYFLAASKGLKGTKLFSLHLDAIENVFPK